MTVPIVLLALAALAPGAWAVSLNGRASSQALWFADVAGQDRFELAQYLRFHGRGFEPSDTLSVSGYGRVWGDVEQGGGVEGRLYYLYLDKRELLRRTDVRVGRQFFFLSAGSAIVDGARVDTRPFGSLPLGLTLVGGRHVQFSTTGEFTHEGDYAAGVQLGFTGIPGGSIDLAYYFTYDENDLSTELLGLSASQRVAHFGEAYTQIRFDVLSEVFSEITVGARSGYFPKLNLTAEFYRTIPVFEATSIFSVFAVNRLQQWMGRAQYELTPRISLSGEYRNESYGGGETANVGEAGVIYKPRDGINLFGGGIWRVGAGGNILGFEVNGDVALLNRFVLAAGIQHDNFRRAFSDSWDTATRFWVGGEAKILKRVSATAHIEDTISQQFNKDLRARLALNVDF